MAVTVASVNRIKNQPQRFGQVNVRFLDVTFDSSYDSGGEALTLTQLGFGMACYGINVLGFTAGATATSVTSIKPDVSSETAPKLVAFTGNAQSSGDLSGVTVRIQAFGI